MNKTAFRFVTFAAIDILEYEYVNPQIRKILLLMHVYAGQNVMETADTSRSKDSVCQSNGVTVRVSQ